MKESVDMSALFEEWLTISRSHLFFYFGTYILPVISDFKTSYSNFDAYQEETRTDILMNKLLLSASVQMLQASITLAHQL